MRGAQNFSAILTPRNPVQIRYRTFVRKLSVKKHFSDRKKFRESTASSFFFLCIRHYCCWYYNNDNNTYYYYYYYYYYRSTLRQALRSAAIVWLEATSTQSGRLSTDKLLRLRTVSSKDAALNSSLDSIAFSYSKFSTVW